MVLARDVRTGRPGEQPLLRAGARVSGGYAHRLKALGVHPVWIEDELSRGMFEQIKLHPEAGVELLRGAHPSPLVVATVRDHHERLDGSGYPSRRQAGTIHEFARICAIADVFDAISSERPYKNAAPPYGSVNVIERDATAGRFDPDITAAFRRVCLPFPLGTEVVDDGDWLGVVSTIDPEDPWMPTVRRMSGGEVVEEVADLRHLDVTRQPPQAFELEAA